jgi:RNA polymerase sigma-70 factor (ECF subfamily)
MPFTLWLRHIAQDRIIDTHRRHQAAGRRSIDREQAEAAAPDASSVMLVAHLMDQELTPASAAVQRELTDRLEQVMAELDDPDREILLMRYYEQMSNQEIAATLNLTEAAASMRHLRALRRLKEAFLRWTRDVGSVDESTSG